MLPELDPAPVCPPDNPSAGIALENTAEQLIHVGMQFRQAMRAQIQVTCSRQPEIRAPRLGAASGNSRLPRGKGLKAMQGLGVVRLGLGRFHEPAGEIVIHSPHTGRAMSAPASALHRAQAEPRGGDS